MLKGKQYQHLLSSLEYILLKIALDPSLEIWKDVRQVPSAKKLWCNLALRSNFALATGR